MTSPPHERRIDARSWRGAAAAGSRTGRNWRLALIVALVVDPGRGHWSCRSEVAFWVALAAVALVALTAVVNAWGRYHGGLLVAPAIALLFVMNIFPLMWSFGLSFFNFRANRLAPPSFDGLDNYDEVLTDPVVWDAPADHRPGGGADGRHPDGRGLSAGAPVREGVPRPPRPADAGADPDDALVRRGRRLLPLLLRADLRPAQPGGAAVHRRAVHPARQPGRRARRDRVRRCLDVVAVRHAAGAGRPGQRAEVPLRGGRDRPRLLVAQASGPSPSPTSAACCCWRCCSARSRRSSCSTSCS